MQGLLLGEGQSKGHSLPSRKVQCLRFVEVFHYSVPFEGTLHGELFNSPDFLPPARIGSYPIHLCLDPLVRMGSLGPASF